MPGVITPGEDHHRGSWVTLGSTARGWDERQEQERLLEDE
jgi:hypothetical protein